MFASSSTSLRPLASLASSSRSFSTAPILRAKRKELVELLVDDPALGRKGDRIKVKPGFARHRLVPRRIARWVPNWRWFKITPFKSTPPVVQVEQIIEEVVKVKKSKSPETKTIQDTVKPKQPLIAAPMADLPTPPKTLKQLKELSETLTFHRPVTDDGKTLYGSLTLSDILIRLDQGGLDTRDFVVTWSADTLDESVTIAELASNRIKTTGSRKVNVQVKAYGKEEREVMIKIEPTAEAQQV